MDTIECITNRRSIRAFQDKPVPQELLKEIIATACWSPSYKNSQPWQVIGIFRHFCGQTAGAGPVCGLSRYGGPGQ